MDDGPRMSPEKYVETMRTVFEQTMRNVADAINDAPAGRVIAASEQKVPDLLEEFRQKAYELGLEMRGDAAEAAFSPSEARDQRTQPTQQGAAGIQRARHVLRRVAPVPARRDRRPGETIPARRDRRESQVLLAESQTVRF